MRLRKKLRGRGGALQGILSDPPANGIHGTHDRFVIRSPKDKRVGHNIVPNKKYFPRLGRAFEEIAVLANDASQDIQPAWGRQCPSDDRLAGTLLHTLLQPRAKLRTKGGKIARTSRDKFVHAPAVFQP
jgi:hypothetical protein